MASKNGPVRPLMQQSSSDDPISTTIIHRPGSASTIVNPLLRSSDPATALTSLTSLLPSRSSRDTSPSRQWLSPNSMFESKDVGSKYISQTGGSTRSASVPGETHSTASEPSTHRSSSIVNPFSAKSTSLNEAVNRLWRQQKSNGSSEDLSPVPRPTSPTLEPSITQQPQLHNIDSTHPRPVGAGPVHYGDGTLDPAGKESHTSQNQNTGSTKASRAFNSTPSILETVDEAEPAVSPPRQLDSSASSFSQHRDSAESIHESGMSDFNKDDAISVEGGDSTPLSRATTATQQKPQASKAMRSDARRESSTRTALPTSRQRLTSLVSSKVRGGSDVPQNMIVETEIVPSIPQTFINSAANDRSGFGRREESGTLGRRSSNETIKPRKEKKKSVKKTPSIIAGTASSRADLFEAKVASAVDEDSSDSEETFVYESNPPEPRARHHRDHSRTPSVTSMQSTADRRSIRYGHYLDGTRKLRGKRSMKFASSQYNSSNIDPDSGDGGSTPKASQARIGLLGEVQNKHLGAYDRGSIRDRNSSEQNSPFSQASRVRNSRMHDLRDYSKPQNSQRPPSKGSIYKKSESRREPFENERTPLVGANRSQRARPAYGQVGSDPEQLSFYDDREGHWLGRFARFVFAFLAVLMCVMVAAALIFAFTKPLFNLHIQEIQNVLASEQEIMLDLLVKAINPNVFPITVQYLDVNIFAKSTHVNGDEQLISDTLWNLVTTRVDSIMHREDGETEDGTDGLLNTFGKGGSVDHGTDPIEDPSGDPHTMLLGRVLEFDSALSFDASPWRHLPQSSSGEMRLRRPGNKTELNGSEKWEKVVHHSFELVVRGILKYQLPLSTRVFTASVGASVIVEPEAGIDGGGAMKLVKVKKAFWTD